MPGYVESVSASCSARRCSSARQEFIGSLVYYARAVDPSLLVAIGTIVCARSRIEATARVVTQLLTYCATSSNSTIRYPTIDSDASYLSELKARSRAGGNYYLISAPKDPTKPPDPPHDSAIHTLSNIMQTVVFSAADGELGSHFLNGKDGAILRTALDMSHP
jgi:hypothetical protein